MLETIDIADVSVCRFESHKCILDIGKVYGRFNGRSKGKPAPIAKAGSYDRVEALRAYINGLINAAVWNKLYRKDCLSNDFSLPVVAEVSLSGLPCS